MSEPQNAFPNADKTLVTVATYNEIENLPKLVDEILAIVPEVDILVIDDNSPDGTGRWCDEKGADEPRLKCLHREGKLGLGTATLAGMKWAVEHGYKQMLNMDADFSHHPRYLPDMIAGMDPENGPPGRRDDRLAVRSRRRCRGLAAQAAADVDRRKFLRPNAAGAEMQGLQRGLSLLSHVALGKDRLRRDPLSRLLVPGRNPLALPPRRSPIRRNADHLRRSPVRHVEDQLEGGGGGAMDYSGVGDPECVWEVVWYCDLWHGSKSCQKPLCAAPDQPSVGARPFRQRLLPPSRTRKRGLPRAVPDESHPTGGAFYRSLPIWCMNVARLVRLFARSSTLKMGVARICRQI